jgi:hypothetical protein
MMDAEELNIKKRFYMLYFCPVPFILDCYTFNLWGKILIICGA